MYVPKIFFLSSAFLTFNSCMKCLYDIKQQTSVFYLPNLTKSSMCCKRIKKIILVVNCCVKISTSITSLILIFFLQISLFNLVENEKNKFLQNPTSLNACVQAVLLILKCFHNHIIVIYWDENESKKGHKINKCPRLLQHKTFFSPLSELWFSNYANSQSTKLSY